MKLGMFWIFMNRAHSACPNCWKRTNVHTNNTKHPVRERNISILHRTNTHHTYDNIHIYTFYNQANVAFITILIIYGVWDNFFVFDFVYLSACLSVDVYKGQAKPVLNGMRRQNIHRFILFPNLLSCLVLFSVFLSHNTYDCGFECTFRLACIP